MSQGMTVWIGGDVEKGDLVFPPLDALPYTSVLPGDDCIAARLKTLFRLQEGKTGLLVVPLSAAIRKIIPPNIFREAQRTLSVGAELNREELLHWLLRTGYVRENIVETAGDFAVRGALIDLFSPQEDFPWRLEFEGDTLINVRQFDPATQMSFMEKAGDGGLLPGGYHQVTILPASEIIMEPSLVKGALRRIKQWGDGQDLPASWRREVAEKFEQLQNFIGKETFLPAFYDSATIFDYLPKDAKIFADDRLLLEQEAKQLMAEVAALHQVTKSHEKLIPPEMLFAPLPQFERQPLPMPATMPAMKRPKQKPVRRAEPKPSGMAFHEFGELKMDDHLVHDEYGVCRYKGLHHLNIQHVVGDYLKLEFFGGDSLYLPVYRLQVVQKYVGGQSAPPLDRMGGTRWKRIKKRARLEVFKIAAELLKVHALRELTSRKPFPPLDPMDEEFASHFPFAETPDQAQAIADVLRDLQSPKPMDRLVCGDVGYGKTEVAMRAAFKAASSGKQVALLVPTTILALQHFETFQERFAKMAVSIEMVSRFRSTKEQKEILQRVAQGQVDIVIGTHRLLGADIRFRDLGLLIIDEEHRFGVRHKERIKQLRPTVDVMTLSATPIPRTLHMSLIGLKDFSSIQTPPVDRQAVRTFLAKEEDALIKSAVEKELARGGQVFFVHNRVLTIPSIFKRLTGLFPKIRIGVAHGQMNPSELEKVMIAFLHQKIDILLCTTIIESGIDVPNANTMLLHRADTFGLAQAYQLRGRVGRSDRQAYCYLLIPDEETITAEARQRLTVLTRFTELGAGFQIASHDLEIRGSGNLLGTSQAGFIEEIGYEMYTKMLARTIRLLRGEKIAEEEVDPEIQLRVPAYIPPEYVAEANLRMSLYKRLSHLTKEEEVGAFSQELQDRFGPLPAMTENLLEIVRIKQEAVLLGLTAFRYDGKNFVLVKPEGQQAIAKHGLHSPQAILTEARKVLRIAWGWTSNNAK